MSGDNYSPLYRQQFPIIITALSWVLYKIACTSYHTLVLQGRSKLSFSPVLDCVPFSVIFIPIQGCWFYPSLSYYWSYRKHLLLFCCCAKIPWPRHLTEGRVYFWLRFQRFRVCNGGDSVAVGRSVCSDHSLQAWSRESRPHIQQGYVISKLPIGDFLKQGCVTYSSSNSITIWELNLQIPEPMGDITQPKPCR